MEKPRVRFRLRFILFWLIPYVAIAAIIFSITDPYPQLPGDRAAALNREYHLTGFAVLTYPWGSALAVAIWFSSRNHPPDPPGAG